MTNHTHDVRRRSWVASANGHPDFPVQNLPFGVFSPHGEMPRGGVAIGDSILDLPAALEVGLFGGVVQDVAAAAAEPQLNRLLNFDAGGREALRDRLFEILSDEATASVRALEPRLLHRAADCTLHVPAQIGDYTDFYAGIHHANNVGRLLRPDTPLSPNYKYVPIAYHGRASSIQPSGTPVHRPEGQRKPGSETVPSFGPSRSLDYEIELGIWIGPGNKLGEPIPIAAAHAHAAGFCLLNDWSARDLQGWEYQPLGPLLSKNFLTTISPWIVTAEALRPFRVPQKPRPEGDPAPLHHLWCEFDQTHGALAIELEVLLTTRVTRARGMDPHVLSVSSTRHLYWTFAQMIAHHTSNGCNLRPGDLFGSGTISAPGIEGWGSLLEITEGGRNPIHLASGETRRFLEDGDEIIFRARAVRDGFASLGFGECRGTVVSTP
ncbi:Fumarylacetoacetase [Rhodovastum atsumiense]|uniref:fumarylacetoacetase n=1 Tax=Rhodovastum atsumiense TaxID=504468 RepID=A0A5M6IZD5_9PROT|nr:fumarylacetoacetase [Rhodovastum atsumiense]KAA5613704.1 fumarylacetoacetase [Rhodovastum atsumiense]CAH2599627.1 Fumarylacetoacetase [Rhodovastum atsumiense]